MKDLWGEALDKDASDLHILPDEATYLRIGGTLVRYPAVSAPAWLEWWQEGLSIHNKRELEEMGSTEWTVFADPAYRVSVFRVGGAYQGNIRILHAPAD